ncbi:hypothetical protein ARMSODRAFT_622079 [Armillaria solidipes]|uniref:Uncharacterized protein n=1 Tax=Armillaria solidipes TaxID=1076256 RepID=A0A2H3AYR0_9AGAR|nr:hypothetical protein ARMSODRAFT_622079 [Armillaria solidipes]
MAFAAPYESEKEYDRGIEFKVIFEDNPVFFLQIKGPRGLTVNSTREKADDQMRKRMRDLGPTVLSIRSMVSAHSARVFRSTTTINKPASSPSACFLTAGERPMAPRRVDETAIFWKMKEASDSKIL